MIHSETLESDLKCFFHFFYLCGPIPQRASWQGWPRPHSRICGRQSKKYIFLYRTRHVFEPKYKNFESGEHSSSLIGACKKYFPRNNIKTLVILPYSKDKSHMQVWNTLYSVKYIIHFHKVKYIWVWDILKKLKNFTTIFKCETLSDCKLLCTLIRSKMHTSVKHPVEF